MRHDPVEAGPRSPSCGGAVEPSRSCRKCGATGDGAPYLFRLSVRGADAAARELLLRLCRPCAMGLVEGPVLDAYVAELTAE